MFTFELAPHSTLLSVYIPYGKTKQHQLFSYETNHRCLESGEGTAYIVLRCAVNILQYLTAIYMESHLGVLILPLPTLSALILIMKEYGSDKDTTLYMGLHLETTQAL